MGIQSDKNLHRFYRYIIDFDTISCDLPGQGFALSDESVLVVEYPVYLYFCIPVILAMNESLAIFPLIHKSQGGIVWM